MNSLLRIWLWLGRIKNDGVMLYFAWKHPGTPTYLKGVLIMLLLYAVSPIDIIPDYLPLLGITDDLAVIPAGILYVTQMLPASVRSECFRESYKWRKRIPYILGLLGLVGLVWISLLVYGIGALISSIVK